jgi:hypothetical protein
VDEPRPIRLPSVAFEHELADVAAAIALVASGGAQRVTLSGLHHPEAIASDALAIAQSAGVRFALQRDRKNGRPAVIVGPVEE